MRGKKMMKRRDKKGKEMKKKREERRGTLRP